MCIFFIFDGGLNACGCIYHGVDTHTVPHTHKTREFQTQLPQYFSKSDDESSQRVPNAITTLFLQE